MQNTQSILVTISRGTFIREAQVRIPAAAAATAENISFLKLAISGLFFFIFRLFYKQLTVNKWSINNCGWLDLNPSPLISEVTALPTALQPQPQNNISLSKKRKWWLWNRAKDQNKKRQKQIYFNFSFFCSKTTLDWKQVVLYQSFSLFI